MKKFSLIFLFALLFLSIGVAVTSVHAAPSQDAQPRAHVQAAPPAAPNAQGCSGTPTLQFAYANPSTIVPGQVSTLTWGLVGNAQAAFLQFPNGNRQGIGTPGSQQVNPTQTTIYYIVGVCGSVQTQWPIQVNVTNSPGCSGTPQMNGFTANPSTINAGQSTTLAWGAVLNAQSVQLSSQNQGGSGVPAPGSIVVSPQQTTTYYLTAWCQSNTNQLQVTVTVNNAPPPTPPPPANRINSITQNGGLTNSNQYVVTANYFWNGEDAPASMQATAHNDAGSQVGVSNRTNIASSQTMDANLLFNPNPQPNGMSSVTVCMYGSSGTELVCQSASMR